MIADLGGVALQSVSATKALNYEGIVGADNSFKSEVPAVAGHTYAVVISKSTIRALYVFHVDSIAPDSSMKITYAVKSYSIQTSQNTVPGFDWEVGNK